MMSDLAEIAAAAGITIIDEGDTEEKDSLSIEQLGEAKGPVSEDSVEAEQIHSWDALFTDRYTMADPDYARTVEAGDVGKQPPCVEGFSCFRHRGDRRNWDRDRRPYGDRGGYRGRGNSHGSWNRNSGDGSWNRGERSQYQPQSYGDHHQSGYGNRHNRSEGSNDRRGWGNNDQGREYEQYQNRGGDEGYQNRGNVNYQGRQEQHGRSDSGDRRNRNENQGNKDSNKGAHRDRSPQR